MSTDLIERDRQRLTADGTTQTPPPMADAAPKRKPRNHLTTAAALPTPTRKAANP
jgi:hypothetical protein